MYKVYKCYIECYIKNKCILKYQNIVSSLVIFNEDPRLVIFLCLVQLQNVCYVRTGAQATQ